MMGLAITFAVIVISLVVIAVLATRQMFPLLREGLDRKPKEFDRAELYDVLTPKPLFTMASRTFGLIAFVAWFWLSFAMVSNGTTLLMGVDPQVLSGIIYPDPSMVSYLNVWTIAQLFLLFLFPAALLLLAVMYIGTPRVMQRARKLMAEWELAPIVAIECELGKTPLNLYVFVYDQDSNTKQIVYTESSRPRFVVKQLRERGMKSVMAFAGPSRSDKSIVQSKENEICQSTTSHTAIPWKTAHRAAAVTGFAVALFIFSAVFFLVRPSPLSATERISVTNLMGGANAIVNSAYSSVDTMIEGAVMGNRYGVLLVMDRYCVMLRRTNNGLWLTILCCIAYIVVFWKRLDDPVSADSKLTLPARSASR